MILRHRDREVLRFDWVEPLGVRIVSVNESSRQFLPLEMCGQATDEALFLFRRVSDILEYGAKADDFVSLSTSCEGINSVDMSSNEGKARLRGDSLVLQIKENMRVDPFVMNAELAQILGVSIATIERKIKALREANEIRRVGSRKAGHWEVVSCATSKNVSPEPNPHKALVDLP